jgi:uncharacterized protein (DUF2147 family)
MKRFVLFICLFSIGNLLSQTSLEGKWITIDDNTKKPKSIIELKLVKGKLEGTILKVYLEKGQPENPLCDKCSDHRKNKPVVGMKVMHGLYRSGNEYKGGEILDPENGKIYSCKLWLEDGNPNKLNLRGYLGPFYRTQQWIKYNEK